MELGAGARPGAIMLNIEGTVGIVCTMGILIWIDVLAMGIVRPPPRTQKADVS